MKLRILFNFCLLNLVIYSQEVQTIHIQKEIKESDYYPQIAGVFQGEIDIASLGSPEGIITNIGWEIVSYKIDFQSGRDFVTLSINSRIIPQEVILEIVKSSLREQIFLTEIMAIDETKTKHLLKSMALIPIPTDEKK